MLAAPWRACWSKNATHVAASVTWSAVKGGRRIEGQELAVFEVREERIVAAWFHPGDIADDEAFWGEGQPSRSAWPELSRRAIVRFLGLKWGER